MRRNDHAPALKNHWQKCYREEEGPALPLLPVPAQALALFQALRAATHPPRCFWGGYRDLLRTLESLQIPETPWSLAAAWAALWESDSWWRRRWLLWSSRNALWYVISCELGFHFCSRGDRGLLHGGQDKRVPWRNNIFWWTNGFKDFSPSGKSDGHHLSL